MYICRVMIDDPLLFQIIHPVIEHTETINHYCVQFEML